jgi:hypothetical protein
MREDARTYLKNGSLMAPRLLGSSALGGGRWATDADTESIWKHQRGLALTRAARIRSRISHVADSKACPRRLGAEMIVRTGACFADFSFARLHAARGAIVAYDGTTRIRAANATLLRRVGTRKGFVELAIVGWNADGHEGSLLGV